MKVKALKLGYYKDQRIKEGQVFHLKDEKHFSELWMAKLEEAKEPKKSKKKVEEKVEDSDALVI